MATLREDPTVQVLELLASSGGDSAFGALAEAFARLGGYTEAGIAQLTPAGVVVLASYPHLQAYDDDPHVPDRVLARILDAPAGIGVALAPGDFWRAPGTPGAAPAHLHGIAVRDADGLPLGLLFGLAAAPSSFSAPPVLALLLTRAAAELHQHASHSALQSAADLYQRAAELAGHRVLLHDRDGILVEINSGESRFWPYARERILGAHYSTWMPPGPAAIFEAARLAVVDTGQAWVGEYEIEIQGGMRTREMRVARFDRDHTLTVIHDVTDARLATQALRASETRTRAMLEALPDALLINDADGVYVEKPHMAPGAWRSLHHDSLGKRFEDVLPSRVAAVLRGAQSAVLANGTPQTGEYAIEIDGHTWQRQFRMVRLGENCTLTIVRDVTELKAAFDLLRESESRLRKVVELAPIGIFWTDATGAVRYGNPAVRQSLQLTSDEGLGHAWTQQLHPEDRARIVEAWHRLIDGETQEFIEEYRFAPPDRPARLVRTHAIPIVSDGQRVAVMGIMLDLTEQRRADEERQRLQARLLHVQKNEALGQLTGGIAHEFNNLLASTLGYAALLLRRLPAGADPKLANYAQAIVTAGERGRDLVKQMLAFAQRDGEHGGSVNPRTVVDGAAQMLRSVLPAALALKVLIEADVPAVAGSDDALRQVVLNLVLNARDSIMAGNPAQQGTIGIALYGPRPVRGLCRACKEAVDGDYVVLDITDDGCGIEADALDRIFDPFYTTKTVGSGTGLGLSVVHGVVHRDGGHVLAESQPGVGTRISVLLQVAQPAPAPVETADVPTPAACPAEVRVLVVDDEPAVGGLLAELLRTEGYAVDLHDDARTALAAALSDPCPYALVVSDLSMPGLSGLQLAEALAARHPALPVIICTGYNDAVDAAAAGAHGVAQWFHKPLPIADFIAAVARLAGPADPPA